MDICSNLVICGYSDRKGMGYMCPSLCDLWIFLSLGDVGYTVLQLTSMDDTGLTTTLWTTLLTALWHSLCRALWYSLCRLHCGTLSADCIVVLFLPTALWYSFYRLHCGTLSTDCIVVQVHILLVKMAHPFSEDVKNNIFLRSICMGQRGIPPDHPRRSCLKY